MHKDVEPISQPVIPNLVSQTQCRLRVAIRVNAKLIHRQNLLSSTLGKRQRNSGKRIESESAEQLGVEIGAFGWHAFFQQADRFNMLEFGRHDQGSQRIRLVAITFSLTSLTSQPVQHFTHFMDVSRLGMSLATQQIVNHETMQQTDTQTTPIFTLVGSQLFDPCLCPIASFAKHPFSSVTA